LTGEHEGAKQADEISEQRLLFERTCRKIEKEVRAAANKGEKSARIEAQVYEGDNDSFELWAPPYDEVARWAQNEGLRVSHDSMHCGYGVYEWTMVLSW